MTARLATLTSSEALERDEAASDTALILEIMKASRVSKAKEDTRKASEVAEEEHEGRPTKPNFIEIGRSTLKDEDLKAMNDLGYFGDRVKVHVVGDETTVKTKNNEVVVFKIFYWAGLQLSMY